MVKKQSTLTFATKKNIVDTQSSIKEAAEPRDSSAETERFLQQTKYPNSSDIIQDENVFRDSVITKKMSDFISIMMKDSEDPSLVTKFLTDKSIWNEDVLSSTCKSVADVWGVFNDLRS